MYEVIWGGFMIKNIFICYYECKNIWKSKKKAVHYFKCNLFRIFYEYFANFIVNFKMGLNLSTLAIYIFSLFKRWLPHRKSQPNTKLRISLSNMLTSSHGLMRVKYCPKLVANKYLLKNKTIRLLKFLHVQN